MTTPVKDRRPRAYPAPEFPPRKPKMFARTPPAIFPSLLGLLGLGLAARKGAEVLGLSATPAGGLVEAVLGALLVLWLFAVVALMSKGIRRFGVLAEDMRVLPGRAGLAAATMTGMAAAAVLVPYAPQLALGLAVAAMVAHGGMAILLIAVLTKLPPEARTVSPAFHLAFVAFILGALPLAQLGYVQAATVIFWATLAVAVVIWAISAVQLVKTTPPAPLRPLLAIHVAPAALFSLVAGQIGLPALAMGFAALGMVMFLGLLASAKWLTTSGFSPLWGAFTFPLAALASAMLSLGGSWDAPGIVLLILSLGLVPAIAWNVLKLWPGNRLAAKTNAAEA
ncbi:MAG: tellurium resistance protein [Pseudorhodobacter sp.]|nr:MAG: tellurium resistance protein [Pseudorhodobacter sp.]